MISVAAGCSAANMPSSLNRSLSSATAQATAHFTEIAAPDQLMGGIAIAADGSVFLNANQHFLKYDGAFTSYAYPPCGSGCRGDFGVNTLAFGPGGTVWTTFVISSSGGGPTTGEIVALTRSTGIVNEYQNGIPGDVYSTVASAGRGYMWVIDWYGGVRPSAVPDVYKGSEEVKTVGAPTPINTAETLGSDGLMYLASDPHFKPGEPSRIFGYNDADKLVDRIVLPSHSNVAAMTNGPDGNVWFTDVGLNEIGQVARNGTVTYYSIPTANAGLSGITSASDHALWFTESSANKIGRIDLKGNVSEYAVPNKAAGPSGIAATPAGQPFAIYFVNGGGLGELTL